MKWKKRKALGIDLSPPHVHTGKYSVPTCVHMHIPNTETHTHMRETQCCFRLGWASVTVLTEQLQNLTLAGIRQSWAVELQVT